MFGLVGVGSWALGIVGCVSEDVSFFFVSNLIVWLVGVS